MLQDADLIEKIGIDFRAVDMFMPIDTLLNNQKMADMIDKLISKNNHIIWYNKN
jgi:hypothetical protein